MLLVKKVKVLNKYNKCYKFQEVTLCTQMHLHWHTFRHDLYGLLSPPYFMLGNYMEIYRGLIDFPVKTYP